MQVLHDEQQRLPARLGVEPGHERLERHRAAALRAERLGLAARGGETQQPGEQLDAQRPELLVIGQRLLDRRPSLVVVAGEQPALAQRLDERVQRAGAAVLAALGVQRLQVRSELVHEVVDEPRLADARLAAQQDRRPLSGAGALGRTGEPGALGRAVDERQQARSALGLEARDVGAGREDLEELDRGVEAAQLVGAERCEVEVARDEPLDRVGHGHRARPRRALDACRDVRCLAERVGLPAGRAALVADDHRPAVDADASLQVDAMARRDPGRDGVEIAQDLPAAAHGADRVVLLGTRVAEVHHHAVALPGRGVPAVALDRGLDALLVGPDHRAQVLGVEALRERRRLDEVARHRRDLSPFGRAAARRADQRSRLLDGDEHLAVLIARGGENLDDLVLERLDIVRRQPVLADQGGIRHTPSSLEGVQRCVHGLLEPDHDA